MILYATFFRIGVDLRRYPSASDKRRGAPAASAATHWQAPAGRRQASRCTSCKRSNLGKRQWDGQATSVAGHLLQVWQPVGKRQRDGQKRSKAETQEARARAQNEQRSSNGKKGADGQQQRTVRRQASQSACCKRGNPLASADGMDRRVGSASTARKRS